MPAAAGNRREGTPQVLVVGVIVRIFGHGETAAQLISPTGSDGPSWIVTMPTSRRPAFVPRCRPAAADIVPPMMIGRSRPDFLKLRVAS